MGSLIAKERVTDSDVKQFLDELQSNLGFLEKRAEGVYDRDNLVTKDIKSFYNYCGKISNKLAKGEKLTEEESHYLKDLLLSEKKHLEHRGLINEANSGLVEYINNL